MHVAKIFIFLLFVKSLTGSSNEASSSALGRDPDDTPTQEEMRAKNDRLAALEKQLGPAGSSAQVRASGPFSVSTNPEIPLPYKVASVASHKALKIQQSVSEFVTTAAQLSGMGVQLFVDHARRRRRPKKPVQRDHAAKSRPTTNTTTYSDTGECPTIDLDCPKSPEEQEKERMEVEEKTRRREFEIARRYSDAQQAGSSVSILHGVNQPQKPTPQEPRQEHRVKFAEDDVLTQGIVQPQYEGSTRVDENKTERQDQETQTDNQPVILLPVKPVKIDQRTRAPLRGYVPESEYRKMNHACCFCGTCIALIIFNLCSKFGLM